MKRAKEVDRRVRRTKRDLRASLVALTLERGWDAVSVRDVCKRADVGRSTFYSHFADKEELLVSGFDDLHAALDRERLEGTRAFGFVESLLAHARDNLPLFRALVGRKSGVTVQLRFRSVVSGLVDAELEKLRVSPSLRPAATRFVSGGFVELLTGWLDQPRRPDVASLAETFRSFTRGALASADADFARAHSGVRRDAM